MLQEEEQHNLHRALPMMTQYPAKMQHPLETCNWNKLTKSQNIKYIHTHSFILEEFVYGLTLLKKLICERVSLAIINPYSIVSLVNVKQLDTYLEGKKRRGC